MAIWNGWEGEAIIWDPTDSKWGQPGPGVAPSVCSAALGCCLPSISGAETGRTREQSVIGYPAVAIDYPEVTIPTVAIVTSCYKTSYDDTILHCGEVCDRLSRSFASRVRSTSNREEVGSANDKSPPSPQARVKRGKSVIGC